MSDELAQLKERVSKLEFEGIGLAAERNSALIERDELRRELAKTRRELERVSQVLDRVREALDEGPSYGGVT